MINITVVGLKTLEAFFGTSQIGKILVKSELKLTQQVFLDLIKCREG